MTTPAPLLNISDCFYAGKYKQTLDLLNHHHPLQNEDFSSEAFYFRIAAMVFIGENSEAQLLYDKYNHRPDFENSGHFFCRFFLGVGCVRKSLYKEATTLFSKNLSELRKQKNESKVAFTHKDAFFTYQGLAFFRFFRGQFIQAKRTADLAYSFAFQSEFKFGQILSLDLLGHSNCHLGQVHRGFHDLEKAKSLAIELGNGGIETALRISLVKFRAQFGHDLKNSIKNLYSAIESLDPQDTYSKAELFLELSRQLTLRGRGREALQQLQSASEYVYKHQNKRQSAIYNLRYAYLLYLNGDFHAALALTKSLRINLDPKVDIFILGQANGLEQKIQKILFTQQEPQSLINVSNLSHFTSFIDGRIQKRELNLKIQVPNKDEDPIGDFLDKIQSEGVDVLEECIDLGLLGLAQKILKTPVGKNVIVLGPRRGQMIILSGADTAVVEKGLNNPMMILLNLIKSDEFQNKEMLISKTWNYKYNPVIHDNLLHSTIGKLRKLLGHYSNWIEWSHQGYRLRPDVMILNLHSSSGSPREESLTSPQSTSQSYSIVKEDTVLNIRQIKVLKNLKNGKTIGVKEYSKIYKVSVITSCRDLTQLHKMGLLVRIGRARSTLYGIKEK